MSAVATAVATRPDSTCPEPVLMLYRLHRIACRLLPLRRYCLAFAFIGAALTGFALLTTRHFSGLLLSGAILLTLWPLMLFAFMQLFQHIPPPVLPLDSPFNRIRGRLNLWLYHLLAAFVGALGLTLLSMSIKLLFLR